MTQTRASPQPSNPRSSQERRRVQRRTLRETRTCSAHGRSTVTAIRTRRPFKASLSVETGRRAQLFCPYKSVRLIRQRFTRTRLVRHWLVVITQLASTSPTPPHFALAKQLTRLSTSPTLKS